MEAGKEFNITAYGINTHTYTTSEITRVARIAFDLARKNQKKLKKMEKVLVEKLMSMHMKKVKEIKVY